MQWRLYLPVPWISSASHISYQDRLETVRSLRGKGGKIERLPLAWKAATRIAPGTASLAKAFRATFLDRTEVDLVEGKLDSFVEKARFEAAAMQVFCSITGRTIEAISRCCAVRNELKSVETA